MKMCETYCFSASRTVLVLALIIQTAGCTSSKSDAARERETSNLKPLVLLYGQSLAMNNGRPPNSKEQFQQFIANNAKALLEAQEISVDELMISKRDGKPFVIFYGKPPDGTDEGLVAYEQEGIDGRRYVGYALGIVEEVDEARFRELVPGE